MFSLIPIRDDNPHQRFPLVTVLLIVGNVLMFLAVGATEYTVYRFGAVPCDVLSMFDVRSCPQALEPVLALRSPVSSLFTSMFMHADLIHLGLNMLFLWVFGNNVEDRLGKVRFVLFYFACGLAAAFAHIVVAPRSVIPVVGASGAVSGVLGAYIVLWPRATVHSILPLGIIPFPVRTPAWLLLGMWFLLQILGSLAGLGQPVDETGGGVAFMAHVGGFVAGLVLALMLRGGGRRTDVFERARPLR